MRGWRDYEDGSSSSSPPLNKHFQFGFIQVRKILAPMLALRYVTKRSRKRRMLMPKSRKLASGKPQPHPPESQPADVEAQRTKSLTNVDKVSERSINMQEKKGRLPLLGSERQA